MKKNIFFGFIAILAAMSVNSCRSLDVAPPNNITDEQIQEILAGDDEDAKEVIISALGLTLQSNFNVAGATWSGYSSYPLNSQVDQDFLMSMRGNDVVLGTAVTAQSGGHVSAYQLSPTYTLTGSTYPYYALGALLLTNANKVLLYMTPESAAAGGDPAKYRGQALCVRAYAYMQLMERFQAAYTNGGKDGKGMPIYTEYKVNPPAKISSSNEVYDLILTDLKEAVDLLRKYVGFTSEPKDVDLGVGLFLLTRAALWAGEWDTVISAAGELTSEFNTFIPEANYGGKDADFLEVCAGTKDVLTTDNAFLCVAANPECIMGFVQGDGSNTYQNNFCNVYEPGEAGYSQLAPRIDSRLYAQIDDNDFRKDCFTTTSAPYTYITDDTGLTYAREIPEQANLKWAASIAKSYTTRTHHTDCDNIVFRASEAYLMMAEAYAQKGDESSAKNTLNKLLAARTKSGEATLTCDNYSSMKGMTALQMVQLQTRIEMWCENGREFYNNKRWNIEVSRTGSTNHHYTSSTLTPSQMILEVPREETSTNTHWAD